MMIKAEKLLKIYFKVKRVKPLEILKFYLQWLKIKIITTKM